MRRGRGRVENVEGKGDRLFLEQLCFCQICPGQSLLDVSLKPVPLLHAGLLPMEKQISGEQLLGVGLCRRNSSSWRGKGC